MKGNNNTYVLYINIKEERILYKRIESNGIFFQKREGSKGEMLKRKREKKKKGLKQNTAQEGKRGNKKREV